MTLRLSLARYRRPLDGGSKSPHLIVESRSGLVLTLESEPGLFGQGEAAPLPGYSDDSLDDAERALQSLDPLKVSRLAERIQQSESGEALDRELELAIPRKVPSARYALESALFDLSARRQEQPLHVFLQAHAGLSGRSVLPIERAALVTLDPTFSEAEAALAAGFRTLKIKVGGLGTSAEELAALGELRARAGPDFSLRLDANQSFSSENAATFLSALQKLDVELIEEPTRAGDPWLEFPALGVALDESLRSEPELSEETVRRHGLVALILKPTVLGGLLRCLHLARRAQELGLATIVSHTFEGAVGFAALLELALALGPSRFAQGLGAHAALLAWPEASELAERAPLWLPRALSGNGLSRVVLREDAIRC